MPTMEPTLARERYVAADWFEREQEAIHWTDWFCVGRVEEIPEPADFVVADVTGESIIVTRTRSGRLAGHYNLCRHRGSRLVAAAGRPHQEAVGPSGRFSGSIQCPYHSWTYSLDGALRAAPFLEEGADLDKGDLPLHPVAVDTWGGFVFVSLTPEAAPPFAPGRAVADRTLAAYPLSELRTGARLVYSVAANWKAIVENYNECYHCGPVHPELCELVPDFRRGGGGELDWAGGIPHREGAWTFTMSGTTSRRPFPGLTDEEVSRHKGELIYPNLMLSLSADHVAAFTLWPHAADLTTVVCDFLFHPGEIARPGFDPSDAVEFWDLVNRQDWGICELVQQGMSSRRFTTGFYAPMEDASKDIRRYVEERLA
jgi:Rieske 2Fe-2S family protein